MIGRLAYRLTPWTYTIGLVEQRLAEFVMFGVDATHAMPALNWVGERARRGGGIEPGHFDRFDGVRIRFDLVPPRFVLDVDDDPFGQWYAHYGVGTLAIEPPAVLQLVWADVDGHFGRSGLRSRRRGRPTGRHRAPGELERPSTPRPADSAPTITDAAPLY